MAVEASEVAARAGMRPWFPAVEPSLRRVRVVLGGVVVADSRRTKLLIQYGPPPKLPTYYFPLDDVEEGMLVDGRVRSDGATVWSVRAGNRQVRDAAWSAPSGDGPAASLDEMVTFDWWGALEWFEEDEKAFAHARDPHKGVDVVRSSRNVRVEVDGMILAESRHPLMLFETCLPPRYYLPAEDVRTDLLRPSDTVTPCPYKGWARYWSVLTPAGLLQDLAWSYPDPVAENPRIRDLICFFNEKVDLTVDGQLQSRPLSPWS